MIFHARDRDFDFAVGGRRYVIPRGSDVDLPASVAHYVKTCGIPLIPGSGGGPHVDSVAAVPLRAVPPARAAEAPTPAEVAEELADVTGEDPPAEGSEDGEADDPGEDEDAAARAAAQLERQGIELPGRRPRGRRG